MTKYKVTWQDSSGVERTALFSAMENAVEFSALLVLKGFSPQPVEEVKE